jgi:flavin reductase (DIM6/NTAB) family NADH-FMN oxidoreductase RutF
MSEVTTADSTSSARVRLGDHLESRKAFAQFPSGVVVLATELDGQRHALVASSFMVGVSLDPCLVAIAVQRSSETWPSIRRGDAIGVSVFSRGQGELIRRLASKDRQARFEEIAVHVGDSGAVFIEDASLWFECALHSESDAGDHRMVLLEVGRMGASENAPLVWHDGRFRDLAENEPPALE